MPTDVKITSPDGKRTVTTTKKAFERHLKEQGWTEAKAKPKAKSDKE